MNRIVILLSFATVVLAGGLGYILHGKLSESERYLADRKVLISHLDARQNEVLAKDAALADLDRKIAELTKTLAETRVDLDTAHQKIKEYETISDVGRLAKLKKEEDLRQSKTSVPAPAVVVTTNSQGHEVRQIIFDPLPARTGKPLLSHAEFLNVDGRRLFFKYAGGGGSFDVDQLHLGVLAHLGIDPDEAKQQQQKLDAQRNYDETIRIKNAQARIATRLDQMNKQRETDARIAAEKAKESAAKADAERARQEAEAAKRQADATAIPTRNGNVIFLNQPPGTPRINP
jgi:hypothetical protein